MSLRVGDYWVSLFECNLVQGLDIDLHIIFSHSCVWCNKFVTSFVGGHRLMPNHVKLVCFVYVLNFFDPYALSQRLNFLTCRDTKRINNQAENKSSMQPFSPSSKEKLLTLLNRSP